jgi:ribonuclease J
MVLKLPVSAMRRITKELIKNKPLNEVKLIFSMWPGYLEKENYYFNFCKEFNAELVKVHVSGHAYLDSLKSLAHALKPEILIPVHTLSGDDFSKHFKNVVRVTDGVAFDI